MSYKYTMLFLRIVFIVSVVWLSFFGPYSAFLNTHPIKDKNYIDVFEGSSMYAVLDNLKLTSFLNKLFFRIYLDTNSIKSFQAGEYDIKNKNFKEIIDLLVEGKTYTHSFTIIEGMNIYDIEKELENSYLINDCSLLKCIKTNYPFKEGVLFPDTYFYKKGMKASDLLNKSHKKLDNLLNAIWMKKPDNDILKNKYQALILASIIEKEAGNHFEKPDIAGVFLKRISIGMKLQADPTIIYGLLPNFDGDIRKSDILDKYNIYNTYMIKGLPPTPISMSSMSSIEAAILSTPGEFLFFVANSPSSHYFSRTYDEHLNMIKKIGLDK